MHPKLRLFLWVVILIFHIFDIYHSNNKLSTIVLSICIPFDIYVIWLSYTYRNKKL
jgi:hypothetical protein